MTTQDFRIRNVPPNHIFRKKILAYRQKHKLRTIADALEKLAKEGWDA